MFTLMLLLTNCLTTIIHLYSWYFLCISHTGPQPLTYSLTVMFRQIFIILPRDIWFGIFYRLNRERFFSRSIDKLTHIQADDLLGRRFKMVVRIFEQIVSNLFQNQRSYLVFLIENVSFCKTWSQNSLQEKKLSPTSLWRTCLNIEHDLPLRLKLFCLL